MKFSASQHLKMAALLQEKANAAADPERQNRLSQFADVHRMLARSAELKAMPNFQGQGYPRPVEQGRQARPGSSRNSNR
jgi:hypothetical protein